MTTLLLDGDIIAYRAAFFHEVAEELPDGYWTWTCDFNKVKDSIDETIENLQDNLGAGDFILCLSDTSNFRKSIHPEYKGNRTWMKRPVVLKPTREWMISERGALVYPNIEGDDVLGILQTSREDTIVVSLDKDMYQIEGRFWRSGETGLLEISRDQADYYHLLQTLTGDTTDGYKGCPGIGAVSARKLLDKDPSWSTVVKAYEKAGLTEEDALVQARLARILRNEDWDDEKKEPILWSPK